MAIKNDDDLKENGIISVQLVSEVGSKLPARLRIKMSDGIEHTVGIPSNMRDIDELDKIVEKTLSIKNRRKKIEKIISRITECQN